MTLLRIHSIYSKATKTHLYCSDEQSIRSTREAYQTVTLESLLNKTSRPLINRRQRYQISFTIASSHLQLYSSPWLHSHWSKKDIILKVNPHDPRSILINQLYMLRAVSAKTATSNSSYASSDRCPPTLASCSSNSVSAPRLKTRR